MMQNFNKINKKTNLKIEYQQGLLILFNALKKKIKLNYKNFW